MKKQPSTPKADNISVSDIPGQIPNRYLQIADRIPEEFKRKTEEDIFKWIRDNRIENPDYFLPKDWSADNGFIPPVNAGIFDSMYSESSEVEEFEIIAKDIYDYINDIESRKEHIFEGEWYINNAEEFLEEIEGKYPDSGLIEFVYRMRECENEYDFGRVLFNLLFWLDVEEEEDEDEI